MHLPPVSTDASAADNARGWLLSQPQPPSGQLPVPSSHRAKSFLVPFNSIRPIDEVGKLRPSSASRVPKGGIRSCLPSLEVLNWGDSGPQSCACHNGVLLASSERGARDAAQHPTVSGTALPQSDRPVSQQGQEGPLV